MPNNGNKLLFRELVQLYSIKNGTLNTNI